MTSGVFGGDIGEQRCDRFPHADQRVADR